MRTHFKQALIACGLAGMLVALALAAPPAGAAGESVTITGFSIGGCPGPITVSVDYDMGTIGWWLYVEVPGENYFTHLTGSGSLVLTLNLSASAGQDFSIYAAIYEIGFDSIFPAFATDSVGWTCPPGGGGGGKGKGKPEPPPFHYTVQPIDDPDIEALLLGTPNAQGVLPCGVFDPRGEGTTGWGYKVAYLPGWPDCLTYTPHLTILCYEHITFWYVDDNGEPQEFDGFRWRDKNIVGLEISDDGLEYRWYSKTDAFCGFFPTE